MSPFLFTDLVYKWLDKALDVGIAERDFWDMTISELIRAVNSKNRVKRQALQERASFDYILADLVGRSVARAFSGGNKLPRISQVYPTLFDSEEEEEAVQKKQDELSAVRFRQFVESFNGRWAKAHE